MTVASGFRRIVLLASLPLALSVGAVGHAATQPSPSRPLHATPWPIYPLALDGRRDVALPATTLNASFPLSVEWPDAASPLVDPPFVAPPQPGFSNCDARDTSTFDYGYHASWFDVRANSTLQTVAERTIFTLDTGDSAFTGMIAVYRDAVPAAFERGVSALPTTLIACNRGKAISTSSSLAVPAFVSFVAEPGHSYYAEVASQTNFAVGGTLWLYLRALDVQPPSVRIQTNDQNLAQPGTETSFDVAWPDAGSGVDDSTVAASVTTLLGSKLLTTLVDQCHGVPDTNLRLAPGQFCRGRDTLRVRWPLSATAVTGRVEIDATDNAGNRGTASLRVNVRDRTPPEATVRTLKSVGRKAWVTVSCSEPGRLIVTLYGPGPDPRAAVAVRAAKATKVAFTRLRSGFYLVEVACVDLAQNRAATYRGVLIA